MLLEPLSAATPVDLDGARAQSARLENLVALADAVDIPQRAKTQEYAEHVLVIGRAPVVPFEPSEPPPQVCILIAEGYVVSFQERYFGFFDEVRDRLRTDGSDLRTGGPAFLAQALLDALVDRFYPVVEDLSDRLDELETAILERSSPRLVAELHRIQRQITTLRRIARPQVEALHRLARTDSPLVPQPVRVFVQDVHDHAQQVLGRLDAARDVATDTMAAVLATEAQRQNEVMKVLTLVGSIFIPLTFIAGIYGMNFEHMPELRFRAGYPIVLGVMAVVAVGMVVLFRLRGWIGPRSK